MTNQIRGVTRLSVGDADYALVLDINALCELETQLESDFDVILSRYAAGTSVTLVRALLWAGLRAQHPCTIKEAGDIVQRCGFTAVKDAVEKALVNALPEPDPANPPERDRTKTPDGNG